MEDDRQQAAHLFTLRVWPEEVGDGKRIWRGAVKHLVTGEVHYFRDWRHLASHLEAILAYEGGRSPPETPESP